MSWYKLAQEQTPRNVIQQGLGTPTNPSGILLSYQDYQKLKNFNANSAPTSVFDKDTNSEVVVVHGTQTPDGKFAFSKGNNEFVFPEDNPNWAQDLGINANSYIVSCYQGTANTSGMKNVTNYRGKLQMEMPQQVQDSTQDVRINILGV